MYSEADYSNLIMSRIFFIVCDNGGRRYSDKYIHLSATRSENTKKAKCVNVVLPTLAHSLCCGIATDVLFVGLLLLNAIKAFVALACSWQITDEIEFSKI